MTFNDFVRKKILAPCDMKTAMVDPDDNDQLVAKAFSDEGKQDPLTYPISGWTCVSLEDFFKWEQCIAHFKLINPASTQRILTPVGPNKQSGLGGGAMAGNKLLRHIHDGTSMHYQALAINAPANRVIILMTNNKQDNLYDLAAAINAILDGKPYQQPAKSILKVYEKQLDTLGGAGVLALYNKLKVSRPGDFAFGNESTLNEIGYFLLGKDRKGDAITVFEYNVQLFPGSGNVYDSLGEAYLKNGDKNKALINYKKSVQLDPGNTSGKDIIAELEKK